MAVIVIVNVIVNIVKSEKLQTAICRLKHAFS